MPTSNNVEVSIFYHEEANRLQEYTRPYDTDSSKRVHRYIESFAGRRFAVAVEILKAFNFDVYPFVKIECSLDGRSVHTKYMGKQHIAGTTSTQERQTWFHSASRLVEGQWAECAFTFGDLVKGEDSQIIDEELDRAVDTHGSIAVSVTVGTLVPIVAYPSTDLGIPDLEVMDRRIVEEGGIAHAVKHFLVGACNPPTIKGIFTPATGKKLGKPTVLVLRYLPGQRLERLGVKHPTPSNPDPEQLLESLSPRSRIPSYAGPIGSRVEIKQEDPVEDLQRFQRATAPEPEQLRILSGRSPARERQRRLDRLRLEEIALEKEEIAIKRRMIQDEE